MKVNGRRPVMAVSQAILWQTRYSGAYDKWSTLGRLAEIITLTIYQDEILIILNQYLFQFNIIFAIGENKLDIFYRQ